MHVESGGGDGPKLLLLHGLGANGAVWRNLLPLVEKNWRGGWLAPDLLGHGRSPAAPIYSYGAHAAAVAQVVGQGEEVAIIGHSMGGAIALMLATGWFGVSVTRVLAIGVKLRWSAEDIAGMARLAEMPLRWFEDGRLASERYLRVAGLNGLLSADSEMAAAGVAEESGRFRLAADPRIHSVGPPPLDALMSVIKVPVHFAAGAADQMVSLKEMRRYDPIAELIADAGHNAHVERPEKVWALFEQILSMLA